MIPSPFAMFPNIPVAQALARITDTDTTLHSHVATLINSLVLDGLWAKLDKLTVAMNLEVDSLINLVSSNYLSVNMNGCTFTANAGFTTAYTGTKYLKSGFVESASSLLSESDATLFVYNRSASDIGHLIGSMGDMSTPELIENITSDIGAYMQTFTSNYVTYTAGFQAASRVDANNTHVCSKRTVVSTVAAAIAKVPPYYEYYVGTLNSNDIPGSTADDVVEGQFAAHGCGKGLTPTELLLLESRLQTYFTSRGTAV